MDYLSVHFALYLLRWVASAFVMMLPLYVLVKLQCCKGKYEEYIHLILVQIVGAFIFYNIDAYIFK